MPSYADERHDALLKMLSEMAAKKQEALNEEARRADRAGDVEQRDWLGTGAQGASLGSSFGPWGTLIGGIIGSGVGMFRAGKNRMEHGQNFFEAAGNTMGDFLPENVRKHPMEFGQKALPALGTLGKSFMQNQAGKALQGTSPADQLKQPGMAELGSMKNTQQAYNEAYGTNAPEGYYKNLDTYKSAMGQGYGDTSGTAGGYYTTIVDPKTGMKKVVFDPTGKA